MVKVPKKVIIILFVVLVPMIIFAIVYKYKQADIADLGSCEARDIPGRFIDFSVQVINKKGEPLVNERLNIIQVANKLLVQTHDDNSFWDDKMTSRVLECWQYTQLSAKERLELSMEELEELCNTKDYKNQIRDNSLITVRIEPSRLIDSGMKEGDEYAISENQDSNMNLKRPLITFAEYSSKDLQSQENLLKLMKQNGAEPYMLQVCGEWNAREFHSMQNLGRKELAEHCDKIVRMVRSYYPDTQIAIDLLPFYNYPEKGLCKPLCKYLEHGYSFFITDDYPKANHVTDEQFLEDLEKLGTPYDVISPEYQMGQEHLGDADDLIFLTERYKRFNKKIFNWDLTFVSQESLEEWREGYGPHNSDWGEDKQHFDNMSLAESEVWQAEQYKKYFDYVLNDSENIGFIFTKMRDPRREPRPEVFSSFYSGFERVDGSRKPSFDVLMEFFDSINTKCYTYTDEFGFAHFKANPGVFKFILNNKSFKLEFDENIKSQTLIR